MTKAKLALASIGAALACAVPASANPPQDYFENACGQPFTAEWQSPITEHQWRGEKVSYVADDPRGGPTDGVWRLYAAEVDGGYGWRIVYFYWTGCYY
jgi:hypothetical protein